LSFPDGPNEGGQDHEKCEEPTDDGQRDHRRTKLCELFYNEKRGHVEGEHLVALGIAAKGPAQGGQQHGKEQGFEHPCLMEMKGYCPHDLSPVAVRRET
jgi:hypothetical protein